VSWPARAACAGLDTQMFFPGPGHNAACARAKAVCRHCPVAAPCLAYALAFDDPGREAGIYGGLTGHERRALRAALEREESACFRAC
jgi:WhiB family redox-sensing transcriptional regulator